MNGFQFSGPHRDPHLQAAEADRPLPCRTDKLDFAPMDRLQVLDKVALSACVQRQDDWARVPAVYDPFCTKPDNPKTDFIHETLFLPPLGRRLPRAGETIFADAGRVVRAPVVRPAGMGDHPDLDWRGQRQLE